MCYEERFFLQRAMKVQKREEPKSVIDGLRPSAPPDRKPETDKPKEVERELETV